jgi:nucleoside phosphorylase
MEGDQNTYTTGMIGKYSVVLAHMPTMSNTSASAVAAGLCSSFPGVQLTMIVGICGAVPIHPETQEEIVQGDIVVSTTVIQHDFGMQLPMGSRELDVKFGGGERTDQRIFGGRGHGTNCLVEGKI